MIKALPRLGLPAFLLLGVATTTVLADPIVPGSTILRGVATQDITLLKNTLFNDTNEDKLRQISGEGYLKFDRAAQVGSTIVISTASGLFRGSDVELGAFEFGSIAPLQPTDFGGTITNVVQDPNDPGYASGDVSSFRSGNLTFGGASFGLRLLFPGGPSLYTDPIEGFEFQAVLDGLPPSAGTVLTNSKTDVLNVYFMGMLVATSSNRVITVTAVPEPASLAMLGLGAVGVIAARRRRARISPRS